MQEVFGLSHLFMTVFLNCFANFMVLPVITDVTMAAICPGKDECSLAIYLTGAQQAIIGLGSLLVMPLIGKLSDAHGRKLMLTLPIALSIFPLVILAYNRTKYYFYVYYVIKTITAMATDGSVQFLALAYVADNVDENRRGSVFGIMSGFASSSFIFGSLSTRFLSTSATFQVAAGISITSLLYMRIFLPESLMNNSTTRTDCLLEKHTTQNDDVFKTRRLPLNDAIIFLRTSPTFSKAAVVAFFSNVADVGLHASLLYYMKAQFHFNKDQYADMMVIAGIAGSISQLILMPILTPIIGDEKMLSMGLFFSCAYMMILSIAWASWVPYAAATISIASNFAQPCLRSIASKQTGPSEQGKAQGCITGICSFANIVSHLGFSPLTALFLSNNAPFHFPGFSVMCCGLAAIIAFAQSILIPSPAKTCSIINNTNMQTSV